MSVDAGITPRALSKGDTVAFVSPSLRLNHEFPEALARSKAFFERHGFRVIEIFDPTEPADTSTEIKQKCNELHRAFADPTIKALICTLGGSESTALLPHLDYALIRAHPKIFVGYSDITALHLGLFTGAGLRTFYGPLAIDPFGADPETQAFTIRHFWRAVTDAGRAPLGRVPVSDAWLPTPAASLFDPTAVAPPETRPNPGWRWLRAGAARGRILGGCLEPIMKVLATPSWPADWAGRILLVETAISDDDFDAGPPLASVRADLAALRDRGVFDGLRGLVVGRPYGYTDDQRREYDALVLDQTRDHAFPILIDVDVGHTGPLFTLPLNALVELDSAENRFEILEPSVSAE